MPWQCNVQPLNKLLDPEGQGRLYQSYQNTTRESNQKTLLKGAATCQQKRPEKEWNSTFLATSVITCWNQGQSSTANYVNQWIIDCNINVDTKGKHSVKKINLKNELYSVKLLDIDTETKRDVSQEWGQRFSCDRYQMAQKIWINARREIIQISQLNIFVLHRKRCDLAVREWFQMVL